MAKNNKKRVSRGMTLVELMVVIGIIGVIIALAVPNFAGMQRQARIKAAAQMIAQDLKQIRERALSTSIVHTITFNTAFRKYKVTYVTPNGTFENEYSLGQTTGGNISFGCASGVTGHPPEGWVDAPAGDGIDFPPNDVLQIDNRGGANRGVIYITDGKDSYGIGINSLGRVKIYRYGNGGWF
ncbi:MAG: prepilin-type N-terminal cleavage/methylation domain-containing protein [candidate division WOR-3 bacterium]